MEKGDIARLDKKLDQQDGKLDAQMLILTAIQLDIAKEVSLIKLAHQKLKYYTIVFAAMFTIKSALEYPKLIALLKKLM